VGKLHASPHAVRLALHDNERRHETNDFEFNTKLIRVPGPVRAGEIPIRLPSLNHLAVPQRHQQYVRTSHLVERAFVEERRRTKVIPHLWDEGSVVMLVYGVLIRVSERWGKKCFSEFEQQQIRSLREKLKLDEQEVSMSEAFVYAPTRRSATSAA